MDKEELLSYSREMFNDWVANLAGKPYDLSMTREQLLREVYLKILQNSYKNSKFFAYAVLKSYIKAGNTKFEKFVDIDELKIQEIKIVNMFVNDYLLEEGKTVQMKNFDDFYNVFANLIVDEYEKIFGDLVYINFPNYKNAQVFLTGIRSALTQSFKEKGYERFGREHSIFVRPLTDENPKIVAEYQQILLNVYKEFVNIYITGFGNFVYKSCSQDRYENLCNLLEDFLVNIEQRLSQESKETDVFKANKKIVDYFFSTKKSRLMHDLIPKTNKSEYFYAVKGAFSNFAKDESTEKDQEILADFFDKTEKLIKALSVRDANGQNYPVNYFVVMPMKPYDFATTVTIMEQSKKLTEEQLAVLRVANRLTKTSLGREIISNMRDCDSIENVLKVYRYKCVTKDGRTIDLTDQQNFDNFVNSVNKYLIEYNLPMSEACVATLGGELMYKNREPVNLPLECLHSTEKPREKV